MAAGTTHERRFDSKVAIVTGAAGGIGAAVCRLLVEEGAKVAAIDRDADGVRALAQQMHGECGIAVHTRALDLSHADLVHTAFDEIEATLGAVDVLIHVAGAFAIKPVTDIDEAHWDSIFNANARGALHCLGEGGRRMKARRRGSIVTVGSQSAKVVRVDQGAYGASKAAVTYLTKALGLELAPFGVRCNVVHPGVTETPLAQNIWKTGQGSKEIHISGDLGRFRAGIPLRKVAAAREVAEVVAFVASDAASHMTMAEIMVDGGGSFIA